VLVCRYVRPELDDLSSGSQSAAETQSHTGESDAGEQEEKEKCPDEAAKCWEKWQTMAEDLDGKDCKDLPVDQKWASLYVIRVVSPEISSGKFPEIYSNLSGNFTKNTVHTFQITVHLFTFSLSIGCYSTSVH